MIKEASPILNGLYTPFALRPFGQWGFDKSPPVPGGQKPQKGRANQLACVSCCNSSIFKTQCSKLLYIPKNKFCEYFAYYTYNLYFCTEYYISVYYITRIYFE